jgi:hypothetical protein
MASVVLGHITTREVLHEAYSEKTGVLNLVAVANREGAVSDATKVRRPMV